MNEEIRQILLNQVSIMRFLSFGFPELKADGILSNGLGARLQETSDLLNPTEELSLSKKTDKSLNNFEEREK